MTVVSSTYSGTGKFGRKMEPYSFLLKVQPFDSGNYLEMVARCV